MSSESGSRLTDVCAAASASSCRSKRIERPREHVVGDGEPGIQLDRLPQRPDAAAQIAGVGLDDAERGVRVGE